MTSLNPEQHTAVYANDDKILCLAGAGTGKTFSMISRISRLVADGVSPASILVLTFTNAAAFEMKNRYVRDHTSEAIPEFRTFHSFCYSLLGIDPAVRAKLGYSRIPTIIDAGEMERIQATAKIQASIKLPEYKFKQDAVRTKEEEFQYQVYRRSLSKLLQTSNVITFDILCYNVCRLFVENDECIRKYKSKYQYLFVDEFQDTDPVQYDFISSFHDSKLFVVGDALQAIYGFRGADSTIIKQLASDSNWRTVKLHQNYRSTKQICDFANDMSTYADPSYRIEISSNVDGSDVVCNLIDGVRRPNIVDKDSMYETIEELLRISGTSAILCRTNSEVQEVIKYLTQEGIPCRTSRQNIDAINILKSAFDDTYMADWLSTYLSADKYTDYIRLCLLENPENPLETLLDVFGHVRNIHIRAKQVARVKHVLQDDNMLPLQKCINILSILEMSNIVVDTCASTNDEILQYLLSEIEEEQDNDIYVGTIHSSKGLEYDNVFLLGVDDSSFSLYNEENKNLYYVGITRAKSHLYVYKRW